MRSQITACCALLIVPVLGCAGASTATESSDPSNGVSGTCAVVRVVSFTPDVLRSLAPVDAESIRVWETAHAAEVDARVTQIAPAYVGVPAQARVANLFIASPIGDPIEARDAARARAQAILDRVAAGESFSALARELSEDRDTAGDGGEIGWLRPGQVPFFDPIIFADETTGVMPQLAENDFGFQILWVEERFGGGDMPLSLIREEVVRRLYRGAAMEEGIRRLDAALQRSPPGSSLDAVVGPLLGHRSVTLEEDRSEPVLPTSTHVRHGERARIEDAPIDQVRALAPAEVLRQVLHETEIGADGLGSPIVVLIEGAARHDLRSEECEVHGTVAARSGLSRF